MTLGEALEAIGLVLAAVAAALWALPLGLAVGACSLIYLGQCHAGHPIRKQDDD